jgi:hypothetical protein
MTGNILPGAAIFAAPRSTSSSRMTKRLLKKPHRLRSLV